MPTTKKAAPKKAAPKKAAAKKPAAKKTNNHDDLVKGISPNRS